MDDHTTAPAVTLEDVEAARSRIQHLVRLTPLWPSVSLSDLAGVPVLLKCESLQRTGSFKVRGAANMIAVQDSAPPGVVAGSAGNHAQGVALAAGARGIPATVVMPRTAPLSKQEGCRNYGASVELVDGPLAAAQERAMALAEERGLLYIPPYDAPAIVAGQGTVALELLEQAPEVETVLVPAGGGGLLAGIALALKATRPGTRVVGVQARAMPGIVASRSAGRVQAVEPHKTLADGVAVAAPSALTLDLIERYVDDVVAVPEEDIARAILFLIERSRLVAEGAGALGVAALLSGLVRPTGTTAVVVSGGNIDVNELGFLIERGLLADGRWRNLTIAVGNVPGELARATTMVAQAGANIVDVTHDVVAPDLPLGVAKVTLRIEVAGPEAYDRLVERMLSDGLLRGTATDFATPTAAAQAE